MSGIIAAAAYLPAHRLDRTTIRAIAGTGGGTGHRSVASYDEDTSTMAFEAARRVRAAAPNVTPDLFAHGTVALPYLDKTNATVVHAALGLPSSCGALDLGPSMRSVAAGLRLALERPGTTLLTAADIRTSAPGGAEESAGGDGAAAVLVGADGEVATYLGGATVAAEFIDRWRPPGEPSSRTWEERFGELQYVEAATEAWKMADLAALGVDRLDHLVVVSTHARAGTATARKLAGDAKVADDLSTTVGNTGAAHPLLLLTHALEHVEPEQTIALVVLADGADVFVFRTAAAISSRATHSVDDQIAARRDVAYGRFLTWRGMLSPEPPRRPAPARVSAPAAARSSGWKHGLVGSVDDDGAVSMPPRQGAGKSMADATGTIATFTVDRMAYSPSPPVVFAVVDFDGGGRLPVELTDVDEAEVAIGKQVEMVFRRIGTADGIHNYFWKARLS